MVLGSEARFTYRSRGCFHHEEATGRYRMEGDTLILSPPPDDERDPFATDRYRIVPWDGATFLIDEAGLLNFAEGCRTGWRGDAESSDFLRLGPRGPRKDRPILPFPWQKGLDRPLALHAVRIQGGNVTLDAGAAEGLRVGTSLEADVDGAKLLFVVRSVRAHEALAAWGTLDGEKPFRFAAGCPLSIATKLAPVVRLFQDGLLRGDLIPEPKGP